MIDNVGAAILTAPSFIHYYFVVQNWKWNYLFRFPLRNIILNNYQRHNTDSKDHTACNHHGALVTAAEYSHQNTWNESCNAESAGHHAVKHGLVESGLFGSHIFIDSNRIEASDGAAAHEE